MIPSETNETPFQISRCKGGKEKRKRKEKKRNTIVVRLSLIYSSAVVAITMAIDRACSPPVRVPGLRRWKKKEASIVSWKRNERTYLRTRSCILQTANFSFFDYDRGKERACSHRSFDFSNRSNFFIDRLVVYERKRGSSYKRLDSTPLLCKLGEFLPQVFIERRSHGTIARVRDRQHASIFDVWVSFGIKTATDESHNSAIKAIHEEDFSTSRREKTPIIF